MLFLLTVGYVAPKPIVLDFLKTLNIFNRQSKDEVKMKKIPARVKTKPHRPPAIKYSTSVYTNPFEPEEMWISPPFEFWGSFDHQFDIPSHPDFHFKLQQLQTSYMPFFNSLG